MNMHNGQKTLESMSQAVWYNRWTLNKFKKYLKGDILEVGCGIGNFTLTLITYGNVHGIDIEKIYIKKIKKYTLKKAKIGFGDIEKGKYFFNKKKFDTIVCLNVLEHIKDDKRALKNISDMLKPGGFLILLVPAHPMLYGQIDSAIGHYRRYSKKQLVNHFNKNKLSIITAKKINFFGAIGWWFAGKILKDSVVEAQKLKIFNIIAPFILGLEKVMEPPLGTSILIIGKKK